MASTKVKSYGKINLTLDVTGSEGNFHTLDSFVASVDLYDLVVATARKDKLVSVRFKGLDAELIPFENNNAIKAAEAFIRRFQTNGAEIVIHRNIPASAGLGGSSADISGVLNALKKLYKIDDEVAVKEIADSLGSDTWYMLKGGFCRIRGRGEQVERLPEGKTGKLYLLLLCPETGVSTAECFKRYDLLERVGSMNATENCIEAYVKGDVDKVGRYLSNDLLPAALELNGDVQTAISELLAFSPAGVTMTGSGSAVYAVFETKELRDWAKSRYKGRFRAICTETVEPEKKEKHGWKFPFALHGGSTEE